MILPARPKQTGRRHSSATRQGLAIVMIGQHFLLLFAVLFLLGAPVSAGEWVAPAGFPPPLIPTDNPMSLARIELGRKLFYETDLSISRSVSCGTCHVQSRGFGSDQHPARGANGDKLARRVLPLVNLAWRQRFGWADPTIDSLEAQMLRPMFGEHPVEMGFGLDQAAALSRLERKEYAGRFAKAFPGEINPITPDNIVRAIAAFERTLVSAGSVYDLWVFKDVRPHEAVVQGFKLFHSEELGCGGCHSGINFNADFNRKPGASTMELWHNTGVPTTDPGLFAVTGDATDHGKFKIPGLRNVACTAPYMHNGKFQSLSEVIDHYAKGPAPGLRAFDISAQDRDYLIAFLHALTDETFLRAAQYADPKLELQNRSPACPTTERTEDQVGT